MILIDLINWLKDQDQDTIVEDGFGEPNSYRGSYQDLSFEPVKKTTIGEMLHHAQFALGRTFCGWKGGEYIMDEYSTVYIAEHGECGEEITSAHLKLWSMGRTKDFATDIALIKKDIENLKIRVGIIEQKKENYYVCGTCNGDLKIYRGDGRWETCPACNGKGY